MQHADLSRGSLAESAGLSRMSLAESTHLDLRKNGLILVFRSGVVQQYMHAVDLSWYHVQVL